MRYYIEMHIIKTYVIDKHRDDIIRVILIGRRRSAHNLLSLLEADREARDQDHLQNLRLEVLRHGVTGEMLHEAEECCPFPFHVVGLRYCVLQEIPEELKWKKYVTKSRTFYVMFWL